MHNPVLLYSVCVCEQIIIITGWDAGGGWTNSRSGGAKCNVVCKQQINRVRAQKSLLYVISYDL